MSDREPKITTSMKTVTHENLAKTHAITLELNEAEIGTLVSLCSVIRARPVNSWNVLVAELLEKEADLGEVDGNPETWDNAMLEKFLRPMLIANAIIVADHTPVMIGQLSPKDIDNKDVRAAIGSLVSLQLKQQEKLLERRIAESESEDN